MFSLHPFTSGICSEVLSFLFIFLKEEVAREFSIPVQFQ
ncbi:hypothetical protein E1A91_D10G176800v1 [Gossypium mustelinum]|uniref:Uncharacterized protein n=2 Tax=Gossypium TaxID=3633 RepID=A0A5D2T862_GOSMU|nr:hypothetical protein ES288_D10G184900v1 [Gossypium darwinii]TYI61509.1 hypothetical protein E1A91_D10G176800v1 [Gossypium mustelinum]